MHRARGELDRIPALIARYKHTILSAGFDGGLTRGWRHSADSTAQITPRPISEVRKKYLSEEGGAFCPPYDLPKNWLWLRLPELGDLDRGRSRHRPRNDPKLFGGLHPFIQTGEIRAADRFLENFTQTYNDFGLNQSRLWPIDTVCITIAANIAETAILKIQACFPDSVVGFLADKERILPDYAEFFLRTVRDDLTAFAPATAQKNINLDTLSNIRIPVAPLEEQQEIVRRIETAFAWLQRVAAEDEKAQRLLLRLDETILAKAFRGELVPQDPDDESASVLLERVRAIRVHAPRRGRKRRAVSAETEIDEIESFTVVHKKQDMNKTRKDVSPRYLCDLVKQSGGTIKADALWQASEMQIDEFYKLLRDDVAAKRLKESEDKASIINAN
jgi:type I restriction enzyme S subunit